MATPRHTWYEFFSGGGMARLGLGLQLATACLERPQPQKSRRLSRVFRRRSSPCLRRRIAHPGRSSPDAPPSRGPLPCQDLSLAGNGPGIEGARSGSFLPFWTLMKQLAAESRAPRIVVLENVTGALDRSRRRRLHYAHPTPHRCRLPTRLSRHRRAARFLPQSRPRIRRRHPRPPARDLVQSGPSSAWHSPALCAAHAACPNRSVSAGSGGLFPNRRSPSRRSPR